MDVRLFCTSNNTTSQILKVNCNGNGEKIVVNHFVAKPEEFNSSFSRRDQKSGSEVCSISLKLSVQRTISGLPGEESYSTRTGRKQILVADL